MDDGRDARVAKEDLVDVLDPLLRLDHDDDGGLVVGVRLVAVAGVERDARWAGGAAALRRVLRGPHGALGLLAVVDERDDHAVRAGVQHLHDDRRLVPRDADEGDRVGRGDRAHHLHRVAVVDEPVLHIDAEPVVAGVRERFRGFGRVLDLIANFRSVPAVAELVDLHTEPLDGVAPQIGRAHV